MKIQKKDLKISDILTNTNRPSFKIINEFSGNIYTDVDNPLKLLGSYMRNVYIWSSKRFDINNYKSGLFAEVISGGATGRGISTTPYDIFTLSFEGRKIALDGKDEIKKFVLRTKGILESIKGNISQVAFDNLLQKDFTLNTDKVTTYSENNLLSTYYKLLFDNGYNFSNNYIDTLFKMINTKFVGMMGTSDEDLLNGFEMFLDLEKNRTLLNDLSTLFDKFVVVEKGKKVNTIKNLPKNIYTLNDKVYDEYRFVDRSFYGTPNIKNGFVVFANTIATLNYIVSYLTYHWEYQYKEKLVDLEILKAPVTKEKVKVETKSSIVAPQPKEKPISERQQYIGILGGETGKGTNLKRGMKSQEVANMQVTVFVAIMILLTPEKVEQYFKDTNRKIDDRFSKIIRDSYELMKNTDDFVVGRTVEKLNPKLNDGIFGFRTEELLRLYKLAILSSRIPVDFKNVSTGSLALQFTDLERKSLNYVITEMLYLGKTPTIKPVDIKTTPLQIRQSGLGGEEVKTGGEETTDNSKVVNDADLNIV